MTPLAAMTVDPVMPHLVGAAFAILIIGLLLRRFNQPQVIAYLIAGIVLGSHGLGVFDDQVAAARFGDFGVILLLFFLGMEVSLDELVRGWKVAVGGTLMQILGSVGLAWAIGAVAGWPAPRIVLLGFVISLSSTAVVVAVLKARNELHEQPGRDALSILLVQDIAIAPMLIVVGLMGGGELDTQTVTLQLIGAALISALVVYIVRRRQVRLPFGDLLKVDHELQVFSAFLLCFGLALASGLMGLSSALGAFVAGLLVGSAPGTDWVHHALEPFRVIFVAIFFVSIGLLVDLDFVASNWGEIVALALGALLTNTLLNASVLRGLKRSWSHSLYTGAILAQVGEFSFVLAAVGASAGIITQHGYQLALSTIALTLLLSPAWAALWKRGAQEPTATPLTAPLPHETAQTAPSTAPGSEPRSDA